MPPCNGFSRILFFSGASGALYSARILLEAFPRERRFSFGGPHQSRPVLRRATHGYQSEYEEKARKYPEPTKTLNPKPL